jgi:hypothetical protein
MRTYTSDEIAAGVRFAWAYHQKLRAYLRQPFHFGAFGRQGPAPDDPSFVHYVLAADLADRLGAPYEDYIEAHFWAEHRWRGRHPQARFLHQEKGWTSAERVGDWQRAQRQGALTTIAAGKREPARRAGRTGTQDLYLAQLCARWGLPPEDVFRALGGPDAGVFDRRWLRTQPIWQRLDREGHFAEHPGPDIAYLTRRRDEERARRGRAQ